MLSNRLSHFFDLRGPSMTIDTACSSTLVGVDAAVKSLRDGSSDMAIVAGANLILMPHFFIEGTKLGFLSPTSRCRMWDRDADGYARGEGVAAVVLKPLSRAIADGDDIESVILASGVNSDGQTKSITMPSAHAQADLIRSTYRSIGLDASTKTDRPQFYEAHGTGTRTGDPLEAQGIQMAFFPDQEILSGHQSAPEGGATPELMYVGSMKTLIGHLEACAGLAGLLKASIAVQRGFIPPNLHFNELNPDVAPFTSHLILPTKQLPWPDTQGRPRRCSVGSYGFGGTNAHIILENYSEETSKGDAVGSLAERCWTKVEVTATSDIYSHSTWSTRTSSNTRPSQQTSPGPAGLSLSRSCSVSSPSLKCYPHNSSPVLGPFVFSAASQFSLTASVRHFSELLQSENSMNLDDVAWTLMHRRSTLPLRASFAAADRHKLIQKLEEGVENLIKSISFPKSVAPMSTIIPSKSDVSLFGL